MDMCHNIMSSLLLLLGCQIKVYVCQVLVHFLELFITDVQAKILHQCTCMYVDNGLGLEPTNGKYSKGSYDKNYLCYMYTRANSVRLAQSRRPYVRRRFVRMPIHIIHR